MTKQRNTYAYFTYSLEADHKCEVRASSYILYTSALHALHA